MLPEGLIQMKEALVVDIVVEIHVDLRGLIRKQKPAYLGDCESVCLGVNQHSTNAEASFQKTLYGIFRDSDSLDDLFLRQSFAMVAKKIQDAVFHQQAGSLEDYRTESDELSHPLRLTRCVLIFGVPLFEFREKFHLLEI